MSIPSVDSFLPSFDADLGGLVEEFADTANIQTVTQFIENGSLDLAIMMSLMSDINTLISKLETSSDPNDQKAVNSQAFQNMVHLLNESFNGLPSLLNATKDNNPEEFAEDIIMDQANGYPILHAIQKFLAIYPNT